MLHGDFRSKSFYPLLTLLNTFILNDLKLAFLYKLYFSCEYFPLHITDSISMHSNQSNPFLRIVFQIIIPKMTKPTSTLVTVLCTILFDPLCILGVGTDSLAVVCAVIDGIMASSSCE